MDKPAEEFVRFKKFPEKDCWEKILVALAS